MVERKQRMMIVLSVPAQSPPRFHCDVRASTVLPDTGIHSAKLSLTAEKSLGDTENTLVRGSPRKAKLN